MTANTLMPPDPDKQKQVYAYRADSGSIAAQIYDHLMVRIMDMDLRPFQELSEAKLAAELGVSRTPVREALLRLSKRGLVEIFPQRGSVVSPLSHDRVARSRFIREALEVPLARLAAEKVTPSILALMERETTLQNTFAELSDDALFLQSDDRLHALIARAAGFESIWDDVREAKFHMDRVRRLSLLSRPRMVAIIADHRAIVLALGERDADAAEKQIRFHLSSVMDDIIEIKKQNPDYFCFENR